MKILSTIIKNFIKGKKAGVETANKKTILVPHYSDGLVSLKETDGMSDFCSYCEALEENGMKVTRTFLPPETYNRIFFQLYSAGAIRGIGGGEIPPTPFNGGKQSLLAIQHPVTKEPVLVYTINPDSKPVD